MSHAQYLATAMHAGQVRRFSGEPYINHPKAVVELLQSWGITDQVILDAAWTHDVMEDCTDQTPQEWGRFTKEVGMDVAVLVYYLTKPIQKSKGTAKTHEEAKLAMLKRLADGSPTVAIIKCADRICNLRDYPTGQMSPKYLEESRNLLDLFTTLHHNSYYEPIKVAINALAEAISESDRRHGFGNQGRDVETAQ